MGKLKEMLIGQQELDFGDTTPIVRKPSETQRLAKLWVKYAHTNKLNPKTKKYHEIQHAYLCGIGAVMMEQTPPIISICLASGRDVASIIERTQPR